MIQKKLWKLIDENQDEPDLQKSCLSELNQSTVTLSNLYESISKLDQNDTLDVKDDVPEEEKPEQSADDSSTKAPPPPEIQVSPHIAKYTSDGKPVTT